MKEVGGYEPISANICALQIWKGADDRSRVLIWGQGNIARRLSVSCVVGLAQLPTMSRTA